MHMHVSSCIMFMHKITYVFIRCTYIAHTQKRIHYIYTHLYIPIPSHHTEHPLLAKVTFVKRLRASSWKVLVPWPIQEVQLVAWKVASVCSNSPSAPSVVEGRLASRCLDQCAGVLYHGFARQGEIFFRWFMTLELLLYSIFGATNSADRNLP